MVTYYVTITLSNSSDLDTINVTNVTNEDSVLSFFDQGSRYKILNISRKINDRYLIGGRQEE